MKIVNTTDFKAEALPFSGPGDRPVLTVIVKATFAFDNGRVVPAEEQLPVLFADELHDPDAGGSIRFEADIAPFKPRADIALVGHAYSPVGKPVYGMEVLLKVGDKRKILRIFGDRHWKAGTVSLGEMPSTPAPFEKMPLIYERAFGGIDATCGSACAGNLVGKGYCPGKKRKDLNHTPLPNIEDPDHPIRSKKDTPMPAGFGFLAKAWQPRLGHIGTYDEKWHKTRSPGPPEDFSFAFFNAAHPDLQVAGYLQGDEPVVMKHLSPDGDLSFNLPGIRLRCSVIKHTDESPASAQQAAMEMQPAPDEDAWDEMDWDDPDGDEPEALETAPLEAPPESVTMNLDTLCLIPDEKKFYLVWRGLCPIKDLTAMEVKQIDVAIEQPQLLEVKPDQQDEEVFPTAVYETEAWEENELPITETITPQEA